MISAFFLRESETTSLSFLSPIQSWALPEEALAFVSRASRVQRDVEQVYFPHQPETRIKRNVDFPINRARLAGERGRTFAMSKHLLDFLTV